MRIEIFTDFVCPFCYISKTRLNTAIEQLNMQGEVDITYKAYQLKPDASKIESPAIEMKPEVREAIAQHAKEVGVAIDLERAKLANTENAHRLTKWAETYKKGKEFFGETMYHYFEHGLNLNSEADLLEMVEKLQLPVEEAREVLTSDAYTEQLAADRYDAQQLQVTRVPFIVFNNQYGIIGVEPIEVYLKTLQQAK